MPLLPPAFACVGVGIYRLETYTATYKSFVGKHIFRFIILLLILSNMAVGLYGCIVHQRGVIDVLHWLRSESSKVQDVLFLMPCHSTPYYSHLHHNIPMRFLTCEPPIM